MECKNMIEKIDIYYTYIARNIPEIRTVKEDVLFELRDVVKRFVDSVQDRLGSDGIAEIFEYTELMEELERPIQ
jgi:hypothetical protein